jgi:hypothetical protein
MLWRSDRPRHNASLCGIVQDTQQALYGDDNIMDRQYGIGKRGLIMDMPHQQALSLSLSLP